MKIQYYIYKIKKVRKSFFFHYAELNISRHIKKN